MNPQTRKAVSPVIATVILVAVAIAVSVGVSYWMSGISSQYTQFEKIEIQTGYSTADSGGLGWLIDLSLKNSGSATATITHIFVNDIPVALVAGGDSTYGAAGKIVTNLLVTGMPINVGESTTIKIWITSGGVAADPAFYLTRGL